MIGGLLKSTSSAALFAALGLVALSGGVAPAKAADLGGDCCADLEERVAELEATTARKGNRKVSLTISGQVHTQVMAWDAGNSDVGLKGGTATSSVKGSGSDVYVTDYTAGTGFNLTGSANINPNLTAGFLINLGFDTGSRSHQVSQIDDDNQTFGDASIVVTRAAWYLDHKQVGRLTVGRANTATHGITTIDLGGAGVIASADIGYWNGGFFVGNGENTWDQVLGGGVINGAGSTRGNIIHYTSPTVGGFSVQAAYGEDNIWDVALRYAGEFSGFRLAAGVGYIDNFKSNNGGEIAKDQDNEPGVSAVKAGASILHVASGLYLTAAYVNQDNGDIADDNTTLLYVNGGIAKNWTGLGNTVLYGEYAQVKDATNLSAIKSGDITITPPGTNFGDSDVWGLGIVQNIDAAAMEVYLSFRQYSTDFANTDDFNIVMAGSRIRF